LAYKFSPEKAEKLEEQERYKEFRPLERLKHAGMRAGHRVVDVGTGTGFYTRAAADIVGPEGEVIGLDILPEMIKEAKARGAPEHVSFRVSSESTFPVETGSADWVIMTNLFHELENPDEFLAEIHRILTAEGRVYLTDWSPQEEEEGPPKAHRIEQTHVKRVIASQSFHVISNETLGTSHYEIVFAKSAQKG